MEIIITLCATRPSVRSCHVNLSIQDTNLGMTQKRKKRHIHLSIISVKSQIWVREKSPPISSLSSLVLFS